MIGSDRQSSAGSGFLVSADGLAITNYHVVSQVALEPKTYRLEYAGADGSKGELELLAIDLPNDLAIVRLDRQDAPFSNSARRMPGRGLAKGERLYSMGNPLDLGFTIVEGIYNGLVERSYNERIHFTGALNAGMSGGPAVTADGRVVGINVSKRTGGELLSFLVPARFAVAPAAGPRRGSGAGKGFPRRNRAPARRLAIGSLQGGRGGRIRSVAFGPYKAPEAAAPWFACWGQTNAGTVPKPRAGLNSTTCRSNTTLFVANDLVTGLIKLNHSYAKAVNLNEFQFASFLSAQVQPRPTGLGFVPRKWQTPPRCHEDFVVASAAPDRPPLRVTWCAQAYREFSGLYDVSVTAVTEDRGREALVSRLNLQAVAFADAMTLSKRFLEAVQWTK